MHHDHLYLRQSYTVQYPSTFNVASTEAEWNQFNSHNVLFVCILFYRVAIS